MLNRWNFLKTGFYEGINVHIEYSVQLPYNHSLRPTLSAKLLKCDAGELKRQECRFIQVVSHQPLGFIRPRLYEQDRTQCGRVHHFTVHPYLP